MQKFNLNETIITPFGKGVVIEVVEDKRYDGIYKCKLQGGASAYVKGIEARKENENAE